MSKRTPPEEGHLEKVARRVVSEGLGVKVTRYDDGAVNHQVDALIHLPSGPVPLEVVSDVDPQYEMQWAALRRIGSVLQSNLPHSWMVFLTNDGHIRTLRRELPRILADWPKDVPEWKDPIGDELRELGVAGVVELEGDVRGQIVLTHEGWNSWDDTIELNEWILRVLSRESDVAAKLERHGGAERHAFIWSRPSSAYAVNSLLEQDDDDIGDPVYGPPLPAGITHLWVASTMTRRGCLVLTEGQWRRTAWRTVEAD